MTPPTHTAFRSVVALSGGVGGAKLLDGLARALDPDRLTAIVNTGDDFTHWGLHICPDLDTVMYTLAGLSHPTQGWGLAGESFEALAMIRRYGAPGWFQLGDRDLGTHIARTLALRDGQTLSQITDTLCRALNVRHPILPMADAPRPTFVDTDSHGALPFQDWLVLHRAAPAPRAIRFEGPPTPTPAALDALHRADLVIITPSNPYVSIDPILALDGVRDALRHLPVLAISPILGGRAVKGPLADMIPALAAKPPSARAVFDHYGDLLDAVALEADDADQIPPGLPGLATSTLMGDRDDRARLAFELLDFAAERLR